MSRVKQGRIPAFKERFNKLSERFSTKAAFADYLGLSVQSVGFWLNGDRVPDAANLMVIRDKMGVSIDWLLGYEDIDKPKSDIAIRTISDYTGLSHDSIGILHFLQENSMERTQANDILSALNAIMKDELFFHSVFDCISYFFLQVSHIDLSLEWWEDEERLFDNDTINMVDKLREKGFSVQPIREAARQTAEAAGRKLTQYLESLTEKETDAGMKLHAQERTIWRKRITESFHISQEFDYNDEEFDEETEEAQQHGNDDEENE